MYIDMSRTMGEKISIFIGRTIERIKTSLGRSPESSFERSSIFPVSFCRRTVLRARMTGAYVSELEKKRSTETTPPNMARIQNTHRQLFASTRNPPAMGPTAGPSRGPRAHIAIAFARCCGGKMSAIVPAPIVIGAAPAQPANTRKAMSMPMLLLTAHAIVKMTNKALQTWYITNLPYSSDRGAMKSGPMAKPRM